jgi:hypothetical protein
MRGHETLYDFELRHYPVIDQKVDAKARQELDTRVDKADRRLSLDM